MFDPFDYDDGPTPVPTPTPKLSKSQRRKLATVKQEMTRVNVCAILDTDFQVQEEQEEDNMSDQHEAKSHLKRRTRDVLAERVHAFEVQFGLANDKFPDTWADLMQRITDKKFVISDDQAKQTTWGNPLAYVAFRDPAIVVDRDGFNAASEAESKKAQAVLDKIVALLPENGLTAFENYRDVTAPATAAA